MLRCTLLVAIALLAAARARGQCVPTQIYFEDFGAGHAWTTSGGWHTTPDLCGATPCADPPLAWFAAGPNCFCVLCFRQPVNSGSLTSPPIPLPPVDPQAGVAILLDYCVLVRRGFHELPPELRVLHNDGVTLLSLDDPPHDLAAFSGQTIRLEFFHPDVSPFIEEVHGVQLDSVSLTLVQTPGRAVCFGDGSGSLPCPCHNDSPTPAEGCLHSGGVGMRISGCGTSSISADDLSITVTQIPPGNTGLFYSGSSLLNPPSALFDGWQCAGGISVRFHGMFQADGVVTGSSFVSQVQSPYFVPGVTYDFQYFTRDNQSGPTPCGGFANLSPAYAVTMAP